MMKADFVTVYLASELLCLSLVLCMAKGMNLNIGIEEEVRLFRKLALCSFAQIAAECLWILSQSFLPGMPRSMVILSCLLDLLCTGYIVYFWFLFVDLRVSSRRALAGRKKGSALIRALPVLLLTAVDIASLWNRRVFFLTPDGTYMRGSWYLLHSACCFVYFLPAAILLVRGIFCRTAGKQELAVYFLFSCLLVAGGILQVTVGSAPFSLYFFTLGMFLIFSELQSRQICTDALTGLSNRARSHAYVSSCLARAGREPFCLFMADIDDFKKINDRYGHLQGDEALILTAAALRKLSDSYRTLFLSRYGGDEFLMTLSCREESPEIFLRRFSDLLEKELAVSDLLFRFTVSAGYAAAEDGMTVEALVGEADRALYSRKYALHGLEEPEENRKEDSPVLPVQGKAAKMVHPIRRQRKKDTEDHTA